jgi:hypothetical protein
MQTNKPHKNRFYTFSVYGLSLVVLCSLGATSLRAYQQNKMLEQSLSHQEHKVEKLLIQLLAEEHKVEKLLDQILAKEQLDGEKAFDPMVLQGVPQTATIETSQVLVADSFYLDDAPEAEWKEASLSFVNNHGYSSDEENLGAVLESIFFNAGSDDLTTRLDAAMHMASLDTDELYISEEVMSSLTQNALLSNVKDARKLMEVVYQAGAHPSNMGQLILLADSGDAEISSLANQTIIGLLTDFEYTKGGQNHPYSSMYQEARYKMAEKLKKDPSLIFSRLL